MVALAFVGSNIVTYWRATVRADTRAELTITKMVQAHTAELALANNNTLETERRLQRLLADQATQAEKERVDAKLKADEEIARLRIAAQRVSVPIVIRTPGVPASAGAPATAGTERVERAELHAATAADLATLARDADVNTRERNECVARYNTVREQVNGKDK